MQKVNTIKIALAIHLRNYKESSEIERFLNSDESKAVALGDTIANINITPSSAPSFFSAHWVNTFNSLGGDAWAKDLMNAYNFITKLLDTNKLTVNGLMFLYTGL